MTSIKHEVRGGRTLTSLFSSNVLRAMSILSLSEILLASRRQSYKGATKNHEKAVCMIQQTKETSVEAGATHINDDAAKWRCRTRNCLLPPPRVHHRLGKDSRASAHKQGSHNKYPVRCMGKPESR